MKRIFYLYFLLHYIIQLNAQERIIRGIVKDINGKPVSEAFVLLSDTTSANVGYVEVEETDSLGRFRFY